MGGKEAQTGDFVRAGYLVNFNFGERVHLDVATKLVCNRRIWLNADDYTGRTNEPRCLQAVIADVYANIDEY